jgi:tRNA/tmRNA/rRNA uracil-C5-methylase (TrmA/RlmC/RlmD family)
LINKICTSVILFTGFTSIIYERNENHGETKNTFYQLGGSGAIGYVSATRTGKQAKTPYRLRSWDDNAAFYDQMAKMEAIFTLNQINCFDTDPSDTVLDVGCGPGRIAVPMARRAKSVTAMDSSSKMLGYCLKNAEEAGLTNVVRPSCWIFTRRSQAKTLNSTT